MIGIKKCNKCNKLKELKEYPVRKDSKDGYRNTCKICNFKYQRKLYKNEIIKKLYKDSDSEKQCRKCLLVLNISNFGKSNQNRDGLKSYCRDCKAKENSLWSRANVEYFEYYRKNNAVRMAKISKEYREKNKKSISKRAKEYANANKNAIIARKKAWYGKNKGKVLEGKRRRRDRKLNCEESYTKIDEQITFKSFEYECFNCNNKDKLHIDHHRPLIKGFGLSINNAVVLCEYCNKSKGTKNPEDFYGTKICTKLDRKLAKLYKQASKKTKGDRK